MGNGVLNFRRSDYLRVSAFQFSCVVFPLIFFGARPGSYRKWCVPQGLRPPSWGAYPLNPQQINRNGPNSLFPKWRWQLDAAFLRGPLHSWQRLEYFQQSKCACGARSKLLSCELGINTSLIFLNLLQKFHLTCNQAATRKEVLMSRVIIL